MKNLTLDSLKPGQNAIIQDIVVNGADEEDLMEMGLIRGTHIRLVKFAPLGDPIEVCIRGYHLSLRRSDAKAIVVDPQI